MGDVCRASDRRWKEEEIGRLRSDGKGLMGMEGPTQVRGRDCSKDTLVSGSSHPP